MIKLENFDRLHPEAQDGALAMVRLSDAESRHPFVRFSILWMGFNAWLARVTEEHTDARMIRVLANDKSATDGFRRSLDDQRFQEAMRHFASWWPVFDAREVEGHKELADAWLQRPAFVAECLALGIKHRPEGWQGGENASWADTLGALYQVRCNLFHGKKSPLNIGEHELVDAAATVLRGYVRFSGLFDRYAHQLE